METCDFDVVESEEVRDFFPFGGFADAVDVELEDVGRVSRRRAGMRMNVAADEEEEESDERGECDAKRERDCFLPEPATKTGRQPAGQG